MKIITLIENQVNSPALAGELGLSLYIDTGNKKLLFDTGQTGLFLSNAQKLGVDIKEIDALVLSHGHYDHTGGLYSFLDMNEKAIVYAKEEIFLPKYSGKSRFIGTLRNDNALSKRFRPVQTMIEIASDVYLMPSIDMYHSIDSNFTNLYKKEGISFLTDTFDDELFMVIKCNGQMNIITACSHRGISNICETAVSTFKLPVNLILGGFHMKDCGEEQYLHITQYIQKLQPKLVGVCHCTGVEKFAQMMSDIDAKVFYNCTGNEVSIK